MMLALSQLLFITSGLLAFTLLMCGRQYVELGNVVFVTALNIVLNLVLIPRYGITGAAAAMLLSQSVILLIRLIEVRGVLGLRLYTSGYLKPLFALLATSMLGLMLHVLFEDVTAIFLAANIGAMIVTFSFVITGYFTILYFLGLEDDDLTVWRQFRTS
jgi:O-antigen/teichoic acid export membrane protein